MTAKMRNQTFQSSVLLFKYSHFCCIIMLSSLPPPRVPGARYAIKIRFLFGYMYNSVFILSSHEIPIPLDWTPYTASDVEQHENSMGQIKMLHTCAAAIQIYPPFISSKELSFTRCIGMMTVPGIDKHWRPAGRKIQPDFEGFQVAQIQTARCCSRTRIVHLLAIY